MRGVAPLVHGGEFCADGFVYPGSTARQINGRIKDIPSADVTVIAAGTNNIERHSVSECSEEIRQVIENTARKRLGKTVIMSQIPHRYVKPELNNKIDQVNMFIQAKVRLHKRWIFLKHHMSRDDYKRDGLHFNERRTAKYALEVRHTIRNIKSE